MASTSAAPAAKPPPPPIPDLDVALNTARTAAQAAGEYLRSASSVGRRSVTLKHGVEVVTDADLRADAVVKRVIEAQFPDHKIVSEETNADASARDIEGPVWIIDPLDGSVNFAHGHTSVAVSIAFAVDGKVLAGVVHAPFLNQTYTAIQGQGAFRDGTRLAVAAPASLREALVSTGLPHDRRTLDAVVERFRLLAANCRDVRRSGSPSLDIVSVAAGILDAHTEDLAPWDVAAAGLIATEAGALRTNLGPQRGALAPDLNGSGYFVAAPSIFQELSKLIAPAYDLAR